MSSKLYPDYFASPPTEQRRHPRLDVECDLTVRSRYGTLRLKAANLSFGGIFIRSDIAHLLGDEVQIDLSSKNCSGFSMARIVHRCSNGFAVAFIEPSAGFLDAIYELIFEHIAENAHSADEFDRIPARILINIPSNSGYRGLFTCAIGPNDMWILCSNAQKMPEVFTITLSEHGVFDCKVRVIWRNDDAMGLELVSPSADFLVAYNRLRASFTR